MPLDAQFIQDFQEIQLRPHAPRHQVHAFFHLHDADSQVAVLQFGQALGQAARPPTNCSMDAAVIRTLRPRMRNVPAALSMASNNSRCSSLRGMLMYLPTSAKLAPCSN